MPEPSTDLIKHIISIRDYSIAMGQLTWDRSGGGAQAGPSTDDASSTSTTDPRAIATEAIKGAVDEAIHGMLYAFILTDLNGSCTDDESYGYFQDWIAEHSRFDKKP